MGVLDVLYEAFGDRRVEPEPPPRIKAVEERDGVTIVRLQGRVGMSLGAEERILRPRRVCIPKLYDLNGASRNFPSPENSNASSMIARLSLRPSCGYRKSARK